MSWLEEELLQLFTRCLKSRIYCFTLSLLHAVRLARKKSQEGCYAVRECGVRALEGFPWRAAAVLTSKQINRSRPGEPEARIPPETQSNHGTWELPSPHADLHPDPLSRGAASTPGRAGQRRKGGKETHGQCLHTQLCTTSQSWKVRCVLSPTACLPQNGTRTPTLEQKGSAKWTASLLVMPIKKLKIIHCSGVFHSQKLFRGTAAMPTSKLSLSLHL